MSDLLIGADVDGARPSLAATVELGRIEARRALRSAPFWIGLATTCLYLRDGVSDQGWQSSAYQIVGSAAFGPVCAGIMVAAVLAGSRDRAAEIPLSQEAPLDAGQRAAARLLGVLAQVGVVALVALAVPVVSRIEGGFWMGDGASRIDDAVHSVPELLQPVLAAALAGAGGVAIGRVARARAAVAVAGGLAWLLGSLVYWVWQAPPVRYVALLQAQPIEVPLPSAVYPSDLGLDGPFSAPGEYQDTYRMVVADHAMAAWHDVFLLGLVLVCVGVAVRGRAGRVLGVLGALGAVAAVVVQARIAPVAPLLQIGG